MVEKDFQSKFGKWLKEKEESNPIKPGVYELKLEKGKSFAFGNVREDQIKSLLSAKYTGLYHKINDLPVYYGSKTRFASSKPFDCFYVKGIKAYLVIGFYTPRKKIETCIIDIDKFIEIKDFYSKDNKKSVKKEYLIAQSDNFYLI